MEHMSIPYYHVDAFTGELFAGNPAGVCMLSAFPADSTMRAIAAENRHSNTAFVVPRGDGDCDRRRRVRPGLVLPIRCLSHRHRGGSCDGLDTLYAGTVLGWVTG